MDRARVRELHYITDFANVGSILDRGILSHRLARRLLGSHVVIADPNVQGIRAVVRVRVGDSSRALHDYANLYFHARNAMLSLLLKTHPGDLAVLAVRPEVLDLDGVIIADRNAATLVARFYEVADGIRRLDETAVFAKWWNDSLDARQRRMAEVLVPDRVPPEFVGCVYVRDSAAAYRLQEVLGERRVAIRARPSLFFVDRSHQ